MATGLKSVGTYCEQCKGECWKGIDNNAATQAAALEKFGVIPNNCVISNLGNKKVSHCPFHS